MSEWEEKQKKPEESPAAPQPEPTPAPQPEPQPAPEQKPAPAEEPDAGTGREELKKLRKRLHRWQAACALLALVILLAAGSLAGAYVHLLHYNRQEPPPEPSKIPVDLPGGVTWLDLLEELSLSAHDPADFSYDSLGRVQYAGPEQTLFGVDVSHHQGDINWAAAASDGVQFAIVRLGFRGYGSGKLALDKSFEDNVRGARENGVALGVYFFSQAVTEEEAREEARFVLDNLEGLALTGPVVFDWETVANADARTDFVKGEELTAFAKAFCEEIEQAGYRAMVYFNQETGYFRYDLSKLKDYGFWLAEYKAYPSFYYDFDVWQYTSSGRVAGIDGRVDLNLCFGDYFAAG